MAVTGLVGGLRPGLGSVVAQLRTKLARNLHSELTDPVHLMPTEQPVVSLATVAHRYMGRPVLVPADLAALRGPETGIVILPLSLHWSGDETAARFDLDDPRQRPSLYATVIREAAEPGDLGEWLNGGLLVGLWPRLVLPRTVRAAWEDQHPVLLAARSARALRAAS
jgi:hypothetical protein